MIIILFPIKNVFCFNNILRGKRHSSTLQKYTKVSGSTKMDETVHKIQKDAFYPSNIFW